MGREEYLSSSQGTNETFSTLLYAVFILAGLSLLSLYSYLLFHSIAELFSILIAFGIFIVAWNSQKLASNNYLLFIGIAYFFVAGIDLVHTLAFKGMGVFRHTTGNVPTQLWIAARYLESITLLIAPVFLNRRVRSVPVAAAYSSVCAILLISIFLGIFPVCYVEGAGLTSFKIISEYLISLILAGALFFLLAHKREFDSRVLRLLIFSIVFTILSELAFTFYVGVYDFSNLVGHLFKIVSFYLIYRAIIKTGLVEPYNLIFRDLKRSETQLSSVFAVSPDAILIADDQGKLIQVNPAAARIFGLPLEKLIGSRIERFMEPGYDFAKWFADFKKLGRFEGEQRLVRADGTVLVVESYCVADIQPGRHLSVIHNITERKEAETALRESEQRLAALLESAPVGILLSTLEGRIRESNAMFEKMAGETKEELRRKGTLGPDWKFLRENGTEMPPGEYPITRALAIKQPLMNYVMGSIHPHRGDVIWALVNTAPIFDAGGKIGEFILTAMDITERKKAEEALRQSEQRYRNLFESIDEGYAVCEMIYNEAGDPADFRYLDVNPAFHRLTGLPAEKVVGRKVTEIIPDIEPSWIEAYARVVETGCSERIDNPVAPLKKHYEVYAWRLGIGQFAAVFSDITERKRNEKALERNKDQFKILSEISSQLLASESPQKTVHEVCEKVMNFLDCQTYFNFLVDEEREKLRLNAHAGVPEETARKIEWMNYGEAVCGGAALDGCRIVSEDIRTTFDPRTDLLRSFGTQAHACHPLIAAGRVIGTLSFGTRNRARFNVEELSVMKTVADQIAVAIDRFLHIHKLQIAQEALRRSHNELELRVQERTTKLSEANEVLWTEIARRKLTEEKLREQLALIELAHDAIIVQDMNDRIIFWNKGAEQTFGWSKEEALGRMVHKLLGTRYPHSRREIDEDLAQAGTWKGELIHIGRDGKNIFVENRQTLLRDSKGKPIRKLAIDRDITGRKKAEEALRSSQRELKHLSAQLLLAQEQERKRIANEIHDSLAADLAAIKYSLERKLFAMKEGSSIQITLEDIISNIRRVIEDVRSIMNNLHPSILDDLGILPTINWYCRGIQTVYSGVAIEQRITIQGDEIPKLLHIVIFRILQEALNNILNHSKADRVTVCLASEDTNIHLIIEDNGQGFDMAKIYGKEIEGKGLGLSSMRERVELSGGNFSIVSRPGEGTTIQARWLQAFDST